MSATSQIGIIGCGNILKAYIEHCSPYDCMEIARLADIDHSKAKAAAETHGIQKHGSVEELLGDDAIDVVVNLTVPSVHAEVTLQALEAGKHVYSEKPLATNLDDARRILDTAYAKDLLVGCAPDTFLGGGLQTAIKAIGDKFIGQPLSATGCIMGHGCESWHPNPTFFYQPGGGPVLDMGPYYITALIALFGPVKRLSAVTGKGFDRRPISSEPLRGQVIDVQVNTHASGTLEFENGVIATVMASWDVWAHHMPLLEVHGTEGSLGLPDPNRFGGEVKVRRAGDADWSALPHAHVTEIGRGTGVADLVMAARHRRPHRASAEMALHVLEVLLAFDQSSQSGAHVTMTTTCEKPAPLPPGMAKGVLD